MQVTTESSLVHTVNCSPKPLIVKMFEQGVQHSSPTFEQGVQSSSPASAGFTVKPSNMGINRAPPPCDRTLAPGFSDALCAQCAHDTFQFSESSESLTDQDAKRFVDRRVVSSPLVNRQDIETSGYGKIPDTFPMVRPNVTALRTVLGVGVTESASCEKQPCHKLVGGVWEGEGGSETPGAPELVASEPRDFDEKI